jgi:hypothetical protein
VMVGPTPYKEAIPAGTEVRVADREFLEPPRQIAKLFKGKRMVGKGRWGSKLHPSLLSLVSGRRYRPLPIPSVRTVRNANCTNTPVRGWNYSSAKKRPMLRTRVRFPIARSMNRFYCPCAANPTEEAHKTGVFAPKLVPTECTFLLQKRDVVGVTTLCDLKLSRDIFRKSSVATRSIDRTILVGDPETIRKLSLKRSRRGPLGMRCRRNHGLERDPQLA